MLTCRDITERLPEYADGTLPVRGRVRVAIHLARCAHCRTCLRQLRTTTQVLSRLPVEPISEPTRARLLATFRAAQPATQVRPSPAARLVAGLDRIAAAGRGWWLLGVALFAVVGWALLFAHEPGETLTSAAECLMAQLLGGLVPLAAAIGLSVRARRPLSSSALVLVAVGGAVLVNGYLLGGDCPAGQVLSHVLVIHAGALALLGLTVPLVPRLVRAG